MFHVHPSESGSQDSARAPHQELVDKYVEMGLPQEVADFVCMVMEGKEGTATMRCAGGREGASQTLSAWSWRAGRARPR